MITYEKEIITWECIVFTEQTKIEIEQNFDCRIEVNECTKDGKIVSYTLFKENYFDILYLGDTVKYNRETNKIKIQYFISL